MECCLKTMNIVDTKINFLLIEIISHRMALNLTDKSFQKFNVIMSRRDIF